MLLLYHSVFLCGSSSCRWSSSAWILLLVGVELFSAWQAQMNLSFGSPWSPDSSLMSAGSDLSVDVCYFPILLTSIKPICLMNNSVLDSGCSTRQSRSNYTGRCNLSFWWLIPSWDSFPRSESLVRRQLSCWRWSSVYSAHPSAYSQNLWIPPGWAPQRRKLHLIACFGFLSRLWLLACRWGFYCFLLYLVECWLSFFGHLCSFKAYLSPMCFTFKKHDYSLIPAPMLYTPSH